MDKRKIYCEVLEGVTYDDRCLFRLSKVIEANPTCEHCILRELQLLKRCGVKEPKPKPLEKIKPERKGTAKKKARAGTQPLKPARDDINDTNDIKDITDPKITSPENTASSGDAGSPSTIAASADDSRTGESGSPADVSADTARPGDDGSHDQYTVHSLAKLLGKSPRRIQDLAKMGKIPGARKVDQRWEFDKTIIDQWLSGAVTATPRCGDIVMTRD